MVHHIVMWKFKPEITEEQKPELKKAMHENLAGLVGKVPGLLTVEFVEDEPDGTSESDVPEFVEDGEDEYVCPECGAKITIDMTECPNCGIGLSFEEEDEE